VGGREITQPKTSASDDDTKNCLARNFSLFSVSSSLELNIPIPNRLCIVICVILPLLPTRQGEEEGGALVDVNESTRGASSSSSGLGNVFIVPRADDDATENFLFHHIASPSVTVIPLGTPQSE
jgi:hypothetical protein